ncbi:MAG TPA: hypothetical protein VK446_15505 [Methylocystis sp.]|nr:hypothetical protein [Methylocystis sp.]
MTGLIALARSRWTSARRGFFPGGAAFAPKLKSAAHTAIGQIVVAGCALVSTRVYTELLSRDEYGFTMMAMGAVAFVDGLFVMAFNQTLLSICAGLKDDESQRSVSVGLAIALFRVVALALVPLAAIGLALTAFTPLEPIYGLAPAAALFYLGEEIAKTSMLSPLVARRDYFRFSLWSAVEALATFASTGLSLYFVRADAVGFLLGLIAGRAFCTAGFLLAYFGGRYFHEVDRAAARPYVAQALSYGIPVSAMAPLGWVAAYLDRYAISAAGGLAEAGVYAAVAGLVSRPYAVTTSILTYYFRPQLFEGGAGVSSYAGKRAVERRWVAGAAAVGFSGAVAFAALSQVVAWLALAADYRSGAQGLMIVLALAQTLAIMTHAADNATLSCGASAPLLKMQVWLAGAALVFVPVGALAYGALGAAFGRLLSESLKLGATLWLSRRLLGAA